jgi:peptidoglycan hydrolase CwlO-like protein
MLKRLLGALLISFIFTTTPVLAHLSQNPSSSDIPKNAGASLIDQLNENLKKQNELKKKITDAQNQEKTLASQIASLDNQIDLTKLEIEATEEKLEQLSTDIGSVSAQLAKTKDELEYTNQIASLRLRQIYKESFGGVEKSFLGSDGFNDYLVKQKYIQAIRNQDLALLQSLDDLKKDYSNQKNDLENRKAQQESLKKDLENQKASLDSQQASKQYILGVTQNNEKEYQKLLAQVQTEIVSISRALGGGGVRLGNVKRGEVIAFQGNTGCSTGTHLHFGLYIGGRAVDPMPYLNSGSLGWPESGARINQLYGANYAWYMANFGMPGHNGIDMSTYFGGPIVAAAVGVAYLSSDSSACWLTGTVGKGIVIHHTSPSNWQTIYWHIR